MTTFSARILLVAILHFSGLCHAQQPPDPVPVVRGEVPYHVSLQSTFWGLPTHSFSGAILDSRHILTVGDLFWVEGELSVLAGRIDLNNPLTGYRRSIKNITYHPDFFKIRQRMGNQDFPPRNDLAIIEVTVPLEFYDYAQPIKLPKRNQSITAKEGLLTDWGFHEPSSVLKKINMPIITKEECVSFFGKYKITDEMLCVAYLDQESGNALDNTLLFGEGSPLVCKDEKGEDFLCGISSLKPIYNQLCSGPFAEKNCGTEDNDGISNLRIGYPIAVVDVTKYVDWILETISKP